MRVIRLGGRYLAGREQRLWVALVSLLVFPPAAWALTTSVVGGLAALAVVGLALPRIVPKLSRVRKGRLGERLVTELLHRLPDDYWLINDVVLGRRGNIDHVLIGPCGVVVIETKRLAGHIRCYGDNWSVNGRPRGSISRQVNHGAAAVRYFLTDRHPDLRQSALRYVESVVVFAHPLCRLEVDRATTIVVRFSQLLDAVLALAERYRLEPTIARRLAQTLGRLAPDDRTRRAEAT